MGYFERVEREGRSSHYGGYRLSSSFLGYLEGAGAMSGKRELLNPSEIARELGLSRSTIYRWFHERRFGGIKIGGGHGLIRIFKDEFEEFMRESLVEGRGRVVNGGQGVDSFEMGRIDVGRFLEMFGPG